MVCVECGFGAHRHHNVASLAEMAGGKEGILRQRFQVLQPSMTNLRDRLAKIKQEQDRTENERKMVADAIDSSADALREAVTQRQKLLQDSLATFTTIQTHNLKQLHDQSAASLDALVKLEQDLNDLHERGDVAVMEGYEAWLLAAEKAKLSKQESQSENKFQVHSEDMLESKAESKAHTMFGSKAGSLFESKGENMLESKGESVFESKLESKDAGFDGDEQSKSSIDQGHVVSDVAVATLKGLVAQWGSISMDASGSPISAS